MFLQTRKHVLHLIVIACLAFLSFGFIGHRGGALAGAQIGGQCIVASTYTSEQMREWNRLLVDYRETFRQQGFIYLGATARCKDAPVFMVRDRYAQRKLERALRLLDIPVDAVTVRVLSTVGGYSYSRL